MTADSLAALHRDVLLLGDQARGWFDGAGRARRNSLSPEMQAAVATESLRITARLAAAMVWLLDVRRGAAPATVCEPAGPIPEALSGTPGGAIAAGSRRIAERLVALAAA